MASAELSRRVEKVVGYPPLLEMDDRQRREFHEALLDADSRRPTGEVASGDHGGGTEPAEAADYQPRVNGPKNQACVALPAGVA
jgi:hypothetical protein